jgi:hypothetical protein
MSCSGLIRPDVIPTDFPGAEALIEGLESGPMPMGDGGSVICGPMGQVQATAALGEEEIIHADLDQDAISSARLDQLGIGTYVGALPAARPSIPCHSRGFTRSASRSCGRRQQSSTCSAVSASRPSGRGTPQRREPRPGGPTTIRTLRSLRGRRESRPTGTRMPGSIGCRLRPGALRVRVRPGASRVPGRASRSTSRP